MDELQKSAREQLIKFYSKYVKEGITDEIKQFAQRTHLEYSPGAILLSNLVNQAVGKLIDFYVDTGINPLSKDEAIKIIEDLNKQKRET